MHLRLEDVEEALLANSIIIPRTPKLYTHTHIHTYIHTQLASQSFNLSLSVCLFTHIHILLLPSSFLPLPAHASHYISHITACSPLSSPHTHTLSLSQYVISSSENAFPFLLSLSLTHTHTHSLSSSISLCLVVSLCSVVAVRERARSRHCFALEWRSKQARVMVEMSGEGMEDAGGGMEEVMETSSSNGEGKSGGDVLLFKMLSKEGHVMFEKSCARVREGSDGRRGEEATTLVEEGYEVVERKDENGEGNGEDKRGSAGNDNEGGEGENGKERTAETKDAEDANADEEGGTASTSNTNCTSGAVGGSSSGGLTSQGKSVTGEDGEPFTVLAEYLGLGAEYDRDVRKAARVDYYATVLRFARETCEFSQEQSSVVLSLCNSVLEAVVAGKPKEDLIAIVKDVMLPRLGQDPSLVTFTTDDTKKVTDFVVAGYVNVNVNVCVCVCPASFDDDSVSSFADNSCKVPPLLPRKSMLISLPELSHSSKVSGTTNRKEYHARDTDSKCCPLCTRSRSMCVVSL